MAENRRFLRHPSDIPIEFSMPSEERAAEQGNVHDVSVGGLAFESECCPDRGAVIAIRIPFVHPAFETQGRVVWCRDQDGRYEVGVQFLSSSDAFRARMVEQVCQIERYKREVREREGREIDGDAAAQEWIQKNAAGFPRTGTEG